MNELAAESLELLLESNVDVHSRIYADFFVET